MNPLLTLSPNALTPFDQIKAEHIAPAIDALLEQAQSALEQVTAHNFEARWPSLSLCLGVATERLGRAWGVVSHLNAVADTPTLRAAYTLSLPRVSDFWTQLGSDARLYAKYQAIDPKTLNDEQASAHKHTLRDFVLGGAQLEGKKKQRFTQVQTRLSELAQQFSEHVLDATEAFSLEVTELEMQGLPNDVRAATKIANTSPHAPLNYKLTLKMPCYLPVMQFATNRQLREKLYRAHSTRASDQLLHPKAQAAHDNSAILLEILQLRQEEARLLRFANYAQVSLASKMASKPEEVMQFLRDLARRAKPYALADVQAMRDFAHEHLSQTDPAYLDPQAWDWAFIAERLKEQRYSYSELEVKQYFQLPRVLDGLFTHAQKLFAIRIVQSQAPTWDKEVRYFQVFDLKSNQELASFYLDTAARDGKRGGAWMDGMQDRWLRPDNQQLQRPIAHLVCNFAAGSHKQPALLTHDDVTTLFHEFGHGLHHMLTQVNERDVAGINAVEWDAVELPSQFMENFCWEWEVVQGMSTHVQTGEPLPRALFDKMLAAKNFQSGLQTLRQVEFSLFDMLLHSQATVCDVMQLLAQLRQEIAVLPSPHYTRTPHSFSHIFSGGYAAGYYSYKWAEVLSADAYSVFEESPEQAAATGTRFKTEILARGGSRPALTSFQAFRGRAPQIDALLKAQGMAG